MIASAADVSLGLVQHHFTTKANLVQAVDDHVMAELTTALAAPLAKTPVADPVDDAADRVTSLLVDHVDVVDYLCRALVDGTPPGPASSTTWSWFAPGTGSSSPSKA